MELFLKNKSSKILIQKASMMVWMYRALMLLIFSFGMIALAKIIYHYFNSFGIALGLMSLYAATPLLSFYTANFIPDIAALSFFLISWWILIKPGNQMNKKIVWWSICFGLAALIKITIHCYLLVKL